MFPLKTRQFPSQVLGSVPLLSKACPEGPTCDARGAKASVEKTKQSPVRRVFVSPMRFFFISIK